MKKLRDDQARQSLERAEREKKEKDTRESEALKEA